VPPRVFSIELGVLAHQVLATLDARFSVSDGYIVKLRVLNAKERAFASVSLVFDKLHSSIPKFYVFANDFHCKDTKTMPIST
jgi:hypothetical protein